MPSKDLRALMYQSRRNELDTPMLDSILESNARQVRRLVTSIVARGRRSVGFIGMSFKAQTDDFRESPLVEVIESLIGRDSP